MAKKKAIPLGNYLGNQKIPINPFFTPEIKYIKTWTEWSSANRLQALAYGGSSSSGTATIYTIPTGYTFFMTHAWLSIVCTATSNSAGLLLSQYGFARISGIRGNVTTKPVDARDIEFSMPVKMDAGQKVQVDFNGNGSFECSVFGWLEPTITTA